MRVCVLTGMMFEPSQTFVTAHVRSLLMLGHEVVVLSRSTPKDAGAHADLAGSDLPRLVRSMEVTGSRAARALSRGIAAARGALSAPAAIARPALLAQAMHPSVRDLRGFDILHAHFGIHGAFAHELNEIAHIARRVVTTFHGFDLVVRPERLREQYRTLFASPAWYTVNSEYCAAKAKGLGCPANRIRICLNGIDTARFAFRERTPPRDGGVTHLITVGRLTEKKGHDVTLRALARAKESGAPPFHHHIVGGGSDDALRMYKSLAHDLGLAPHVTFHGNQPAAKVRELLDAAHIFVLASKAAPSGDTEGNPVSIAEAQAQGLPVISTRHAGIPEGVAEGASALLVPENDDAALADAISTLLHDPSRWGPMGRAGRAFAEQHLDMRRTGERMQQIYAEALGTEAVG